MAEGAERKECLRIADEEEEKEEILGAEVTLKLLVAMEIILFERKSLLQSIWEQTEGTSRPSFHIAHPYTLNSHFHRRIARF